jgi:hypothetical protein
MKSTKNSKRVTSKRVTSIAHKVNSDKNIARYHAFHSIIDSKALYENIYKKEIEDISGAIATMKSVSKKKKSVACVR